jgi:hypothetical protein
MFSVFQINRTSTNMPRSYDDPSASSILAHRRPKIKVDVQAPVDDFNMEDESSDNIADDSLHAVEMLAEEA